MLSKKRQHNYLRTRWDNAMIHYDNFAKRTNAEAIHQLRVEIKKINALIFLHDEVYRSIPFKIIKPLRKLFKQAGMIRDAQISAHLIRDQKDIPQGFFSEQRKIVATEANKLRDMMNKHADEIMLTNAGTWQQLKPIHFSDIARVIRKLQKKIATYFRPRIKLKQLHYVRKEIKRLAYISGMLNASDLTRLLINPEKYRKLEHLIGEWHDAKCAAYLLRRYAPTARPAINKLKRKSDVLIGEVKNAWKAIGNPIPEK